MVHCDFHTGNILIKPDGFMRNDAYISDMGLCGEVDNLDNTNNLNNMEIYGVMPYVAPEVLKGEPYTRAADIYSFGMIMYFVATGKQPFAIYAHDHNLAIDIYKGIRPEINEQEAPKCQIDLMKQCWDLNPNNRPDIAEIKEFIISFLYDSKIEVQFKKAEKYRKEKLLSIENNKLITHSQAISKLLNPFTTSLKIDFTDLDFTQ